MMENLDESEEYKESINGFRENLSCYLLMYDIIQMIIDRYRWLIADFR